MRMPDITVMVKPASGLCNMHCKYCFYMDELGHRAERILSCMSEVVMERVIMETLQFSENTCTYVFQGGEPTLAGLDFYRKWLEYEERYNVNHVRIYHSIQTNGLLLDDQWCDFLKENHFLTGISLDGVQKLHDEYRKDRAGYGTFERVLENIERCKTRGIDFNILTVVTNQLALQIEDVYRFYKEQGFKYQQYIACLDPLDMEPGQQQYSLHPDRYGEFLIKLFRMWKADLMSGEPVSIRFFENCLCMLLGMPVESCEQRGICGCQTVIEWEGSVYPCDFYALDEYKLGNLAFEDMQSVEKTRRQRRFVETSLNHSEKCKGCRYFRLCRGGCRRHRDVPGDRYGHNIFCSSYKAFFDTCLDEMLQLAEILRNRA